MCVCTPPPSPLPPPYEWDLWSASQFAVGTAGRQTKVFVCIFLKLLQRQGEFSSPPPPPPGLTRRYPRRMSGTVGRPHSLLWAPQVYTM